ncbi:iron-containing alcohol dehydrogenase [Gordoniibacillus kamchatkensis]|nr:iron-containing alcohol dehydrogenase [Paenibacillus sp. VKM B-2647]
MGMDTGNIADWLGKSIDCACGQRHEVPIRRVVIEHGALRAAADYVRERGWSDVALVADKRTLEAAGQRLETLLTEAGCSVARTVLPPDELGDVIADERSIVQAMLNLRDGTAAVLAVGSGTIHDVVRFVCSRTGKAFVSVPTAASVDGFSSVGAPLIIQGFKQSHSGLCARGDLCRSRRARQAPRELTAAGFGDMLGKATSLATGSSAPSYKRSITASCAPI